MLVTIKAVVKPTEDIDKIKLAILNIFPDADLKVVGDEVMGKTVNLEKFTELLQSQKIRAAARAVLLKARTGNELRISLNKQVAFKSKVNFDGEGPLGAIEVVLEDDDIDGIIERVAPVVPEPE